MQQHKVGWAIYCPPYLVLLHSALKLSLVSFVSGAATAWESTLTSEYYFRFPSAFSASPAVNYLRFFMFRKKTN